MSLSVSPIKIMVDTYKRGASDIHIEPYTARQFRVVRIRIDGQCREYQRIPPTYRRALVSRIKIMARLDIAERQNPRMARLNFVCRPIVRLNYASPLSLPPTPMKMSLCVFWRPPNPSPWISCK